MYINIIYMHELGKLSTRPFTRSIRRWFESLFYINFVLLDACLELCHLLALERITRPMVWDFGLKALVCLPKTNREASNPVPSYHGFMEAEDYNQRQVAYGSTES